MTTPTDAQVREEEDMVKVAASLTASVPQAVPLPRGVASADSSGFVDMSAFSVSDPDWVDKALASARGETPAADAGPEKPIPTMRGVVLKPESIAPVALSSLVASADAAPRPRRPLVALALLTAACVVIVVAAVGAKAWLRAPTELAVTAVSDATRGAALAALMLPPSPAADPAPSPASLAAPAASPAAPATAPAAPASIAGTPKSPVRGAPIGASAPARAKPVAIPKATTASGGSPSLEEMMRRAAQAPKPRK